MAHEYRFEPCVSAIMASALKPIAELHGISPDIAMQWVARVSADDIIDLGPGTFPTCDGEVVFLVGNNPEFQVKVIVKVARIVLLENSQTWIGKYVGCKCRDWSWAYPIDWKTGEKLQPQILLGEYPFSYLSMKHYS